MKNNIITFFILSILIIVLLFIGKNLANKGLDIISDAGMQNSSTALLLAQAKVKVISENALLNEDDSLYIGIPVNEVDNEIILDFIEKGILKGIEGMVEDQSEVLNETEKELKSSEEQNVIKEDKEEPNSNNEECYYVWDQEILDQLKIDVVLAKDEYYIVDYATTDVITTQGIAIKGSDKILYKLSEIKEILD